jgi:sulfate transport system substrate-binding protein
LWALLAIVVLGLIIHQQLSTTTIPLPRTITIYGFSAMETVMNEAILPAFQKHWEESTGQRVEFITTFAGSGAITQEILRKLPVDVAVLSTELDAERLVERGLLLASSSEPSLHAGVFCRSPMVMLVRHGNPHQVRNFDDLGRDGIQLVLADPATSGGAEMALLSVYAAAYRATADQEFAIRRTVDAWSDAEIVAPSARAARRAFRRGTGDVLITYESEAIAASSLDDVTIVYPARTLMTEPVAYKIVKHVTEEERELVEALIAFLWSEQAQRSLVQHGFRSVDETRNENESRFAAEFDFVSLVDLGGPRMVKQSVVEVLWRERIARGPSPRRAGSPGEQRGADTD